jgi:hypothetical protein
LTLAEGRTYFTESFTHYLVVLSKELSNQSFHQVVEIIQENERFTKIKLTTESLIDTGTYRYEVYGQNSSTNIDINNASVVGLVEVGQGNLTTSQEFYDATPLTIPTDVIYR